MAYQVFISYSSEDQLVADAICGKLEESPHRIRCWIAHREIPLGADWDDCIEEALGECKVLVLVFSANADQSKWVKKEILLADHKKLVIIPFRIEAVQPTKGLLLLLYRKHWLDAMTPPLERHLDKLVEDVTKQLNPEAEENVPQPLATIPTPETQRVVDDKQPSPEIQTASRQSFRETLPVSIPKINPTRLVSSSGENRSFFSHVFSAIYSQSVFFLNPIAFSPDGKFLAKSTGMGAEIWDIGSREVLVTLTGHAEAVESMAFSPDGKLLATGGRGDNARIWDSGSGELRVTLTGHSEVVESIAFSPDGKLLATGSGDKSARLWNADNGELLDIYLGHTST